MVIVKVLNTETGNEKEYKGDYVIGFVAKVNDVFGSTSESFVNGRVKRGKALSLLKRHYKEMKKVLKNDRSNN